MSPIPMSAIDRVKELLAAATGISWYAGELANGELVVFARREKDDRIADSILEAITPGGTSDDVRLAALAYAFAQALVGSQAALAESSRDFHDENLHREDYESCRGCESARAALRMDGLEKAMEG